MTVATDKLASEYRVGTELELWAYDTTRGDGGSVYRRTYTRLDREGITEKVERGQGPSWPTRKVNPHLWFHIEYNLVGRALHCMWFTDDQMDDQVLHRRTTTKAQACQKLDEALKSRLQSAEKEVELVKQRIADLAPHLAS